MEEKYGFDFGKFYMNTIYTNTECGTVKIPGILKSIFCYDIQFFIKTSS